MTNVIKLYFGDWGENVSRNVKWSYFNEWYGIKEVIDERICEMEEDPESGIDNVKQLMDEVISKKWGNYVIDCIGSDGHEFNNMYFNIDELKDKIIKINYDSDKYELLDSCDEELELICGEFDEEDYVVLGNEDCTIFKVVKFSSDLLQ